MQCFCCQCRHILTAMLDCGKCLALKTNTPHTCGFFSKIPRHLYAYSETTPYIACSWRCCWRAGKSEESGLEELKAQIAEDKKKPRKLGRSLKSSGRRRGNKTDRLVIPTCFPDAEQPILCNDPNHELFRRYRHGPHLKYNQVDQAGTSSLSVHSGINNAALEPSCRDT